MNPSNQSELKSSFPRSAWKSQLAYLKAVLKAKQAIEKAESATKQKD